MNKVKVGIIGCGKISSAYFNATKRFEILEVTACADLDVERARAKAAEFNIAKACSVEELLADQEIEIVINLTIPKAHANVCLQVLNAGKHVYVEKPLAVTIQEGQAILSLAAEKGLFAGSAPDTFLGGGIQTCRKLIDEGAIGEPVAATAFMMSRGHEHWHPDPEFYYEAGGGPMFDMGPYYLTALVALIGPIKRITGSTRITFPQRTITSSPKAGKSIDVQVPTHVAGILDFQSGAIGTMITSFDIFGGADLPRIEIYGSEGTLKVPDPNTFGGQVFLRRRDEKEWTEVPLTHGFTDNSRGLGVADLAHALRSGRAHRANGSLAYHVLEAMHAFHESSTTGVHYQMTSTCERPAPLRVGLPNDRVDD
ncbi:MAG: oxidoreductase domain protein [Bacilli bacterium]|nr:oxidoreductase domain protein [Bacilli bacterium]